MTASLTDPNTKYFSADSVPRSSRTYPTSANAPKLLISTPRIRNNTSPAPASTRAPVVVNASSAYTDPSRSVPPTCSEASATTSAVAGNRIKAAHVLSSSTRKVPLKTVSTCPSRGTASPAATSSHQS